MASTTAVGPDDLLSRLRSSRSFTLTLFTVVVVLLFSDQNLMAPNLSAIAKEFNFSDEVRKETKQDSLRCVGGPIAVCSIAGYLIPSHDCKVEKMTENYTPPP